jgi:DHA3 family macrolide efflux protein-like MFS transporter
MSERALWRHAGFRRLFASSASYALGIQVYQLALPLAFYELTRSAGVMTGLRAVELLPNLLLAMFIGVWVDRIERARWARRAMAGMVVLMGTQALLLAHGTSLIALFFGAAFGLMTLNYVYGICRIGLVKEMLPPALLLPATGQLSTVTQVAAVAGPALAGVLVAWQPAAGLWAAMAALLCAAALLRGLDLPSRPIATMAFWPAFRDGWRVLRENRPLWHVAWVIVATNGSAGVVDVLFLFRARDQLQIAPGTLGAMVALAACGGLVGGMACGALRRHLGLGRLLTLAMSVEAVSIALLATGHGAALLVASLALNSFAQVVGNVCVWGYRQESTASDYIGRVSGMTGSLFKLGMPLALVVSGQLAAQQSIGVLLGVCAAVHLLASMGVRWSAMYAVR